RGRFHCSRTRRTTSISLMRCAKRGCPSSSTQLADARHQTHRPCACLPGPYRIFAVVAQTEGKHPQCQLETLMLDATRSAKRRKADIPISTPAWCVRTKWRRMVQLCTISPAVAYPEG